VIAAHSHHVVQVLCLWLLVCGGSLAADPRLLLDPSADDVAFRPSSGQVTHAKEPTGQGMGLSVRIATGDEGYPGLAVMPRDGVWDLSAHGHVEARVINTGGKPLQLSLRVDNAGPWQDQPWNTEARTVRPGETGTIKVIFGHAYGFKPGYKLDPSRVPQVLLFTGKVNDMASFSVVSIVAGGEPGETPPVDPRNLRIKPKDGVMLGRGVTMDVATQVSTRGGVVAAAADDGVRLTFPGQSTEQGATIKPAEGRWDLRNATQVSVTIRNTGAAPVSPRMRLETNGGPGEWHRPAEPVAPGQVQQIVLPFMSSVVWEGPDEFKGEHIKGRAGVDNRPASDAVAGVAVVADRSDAPRTLEVLSITAEAPPITLPEWVGKRPPVDGDWAITFEDNFDGTSIDLDRWNIYTSNFWDKRSHFTRDNVIVEDGLVKLRYEKKRGFHNDDPNGKETDYAVGFLDTYGKWVQRYGYFEARMKLPTAPGLWPAFWMMPDRGADKGPQWVRADTKHGGMEFDIMEHLTRWGPYRYNIAMHWDGYQKEHRATGADRIYVSHDEEGFITSGLLWLPGLAVFYCNGVEVARWENDRVSNVQSYPILYMVSGGWDNNALDDSKLPDDFVIDYIRIWQRSDLASEVDGPQPQPANAPSQ
jgi:beta-glucanase (GH16 family)